MIVRAIRAEERDRFVAIDREQSDLLATHVQEAFASGSTSEDWCRVIERDERWVGRYFLRAPAGHGEIFIHFFDVALEEADADEIAGTLIRSVLAAPGDDDDRTILFALDEEHPWHPEPARRHGWFRDAGFALARTTQRWEWPLAGSAPQPSGRLRFRSIDQIGEEVFRRAIADVSDGTLDGRLQEMRRRLGREGDSTEHFSLLTSIDHEPSWLQLAYDHDDQLVGLFAAGKAIGVTFITYVGVVPEMRGRGYVDEVLTYATALLREGGQETIRADTDIANQPMAKAFARAGFVNFMTRTEYTMTAEQRRKLHSASAAET